MEIGGCWPCMLIFAVVWGIFPIGVVAIQSSPPLLLHNGTIYTMSTDIPYASAVCMRDGKIVVVGDEQTVLTSECAKAARESAGVVDVSGATLLPGFSDSHAHLMMEAARRTKADLSSARSAVAAVKATAEFAKEHADLVNASGGWVQGFGWDQTTWEDTAFPTRHDLDGVFPDKPALLMQLSGHACWVNSKALEIAAADIPASGDPPGGHIERDADGRPTGIFSDQAMDLITKHVPPLSDDQADKVLSEVLHDCNAHGLTGVHDLDARAQDIRIFQERHARGNLTLRVYAMRDAVEDSPEDPMVTTDDGLLTVRGVKFFADGAMGSWSAAMLEPYDDKPGVKGTLVYRAEDLHGNISAWADKGYQIATHAIGDAANRQVLDAYERLLASHPGDMRWRIEHAQILSAADLQRFAKLGVIPSMQPSHCASDLSYALRRLGFDRSSRSYAWMSLLKSGVRALPFGSDFPTAGTIPPLLGLHAAVTRQTPEGVPAGGWFPEQRVTRVQAIKGFTVDAAYASFRERVLGSISPGFFSDIVVLDRDVLTVDASGILNASVLATIVHGRVVYAASGGPLSDFTQRHSVPAAHKIHNKRSGIPLAPGAATLPQRLNWWRFAYEAGYREDRWVPSVPSRSPPLVFNALRGATESSAASRQLMV